jgi:hypothetical protein
VEEFDALSLGGFEGPAGLTPIAAGCYLFVKLLHIQGLFASFNFQKD